MCVSRGFTTNKCNSGKGIVKRHFKFLEIDMEICDKTKLFGEIKYH